MKPAFSMVFLIAMVVALLLPSPSPAQAPDTVIVPANPPGSGGLTIEKFIMGDTTAGGLRNNPNRVYVLRQNSSLDTVYYYFDPIYLKSNLTIIGKNNPVTGMPPVIQPFIRQDNSSPSNFVVSSSKGAVITLRGLYFLGLRYDSIQATANLININTDSTTVNLDRCVIDNANGTLANFNASANWNTFTMTNCEYRNGSNQFWQAGNGMWANNAVPMDTVIMRNNTFFCVGRAAYGGPGYYGYLLLEHNTFFLGTGGLLLSPRMTNARIVNNVFYGMIAHGADSTYIKASSANAAKQGFGIVMMDSLASVGTTYGFTEAQRHVEVRNNAYFWPPAMINLWKSINDTATGWVIVPPKWMNEKTADMFTTPAGWPGFAQSDNDSVDPGFPPGVVGPAVDSLMKFVTLVGWTTPYGKIGDAGKYRWWQLRTNPDPLYVFSQVPAGWNSWYKGYPVPENLRYTNAALLTAGTDGLPLGDLNWFTNIVSVGETQNPIPSHFGLSNNYPNPFNPSTTIKVSLDRSGTMSLKIYNLLGELVQVVDQSDKPAGEYTYKVSMEKFGSGVYFFTLRQGENVMTKRMLLLK